VKDDLTSLPPRTDPWPPAFRRSCEAISVSSSYLPSPASHQLKNDTSGSRSLVHQFKDGVLDPDAPHSQQSRIILNRDVKGLPSLRNQPGDHGWKASLTRDGSATKSPDLLLHRRICCHPRPVFKFFSFLLDPPIIWSVFLFRVWEFDDSLMRYQPLAAA
jgi:hypothetical protein